MLKIQIIETIIAISVFIVLKIFITGYFERVVARNIASKNRIKVVKKALNIILVSILLIVLFSIFGVDQSELAMFLGSVLTVIGIALFAQWSFLSNITSGVIIFFNHTAKLEDVVTIIDKDYEIEGRISDIGLFFVILKTKDHEQIVIPNSV
ncbi:MAG: mechanosensitive ion channel, partial [Bacteroidetes bacterium]